MGVFLSRTTCHALLTLTLLAAHLPLLVVLPALNPAGIMTRVAATTVVTATAIEVIVGIVEMETETVIEDTVVETAETAEMETVIEDIVVETVEIVEDPSPPVFSLVTFPREPTLQVTANWKRFSLVMATSSLCPSKTDLHLLNLRMRTI